MSDFDPKRTWYKAIGRSQINSGHSTRAARCPLLTRMPHSANPQAQSTNGYGLLLKAFISTLSNANGTVGAVASTSIGSVSPPFSDIDA